MYLIIILITSFQITTSDLSSNPHKKSEQFGDNQTEKEADCGELDHVAVAGFRLLCAEVAPGTIKHISVHQKSPGLAELGEEESLVDSKLVGYHGQLRLSFEVNIQPVHQEVSTLSLGTKWS